MKHSLRLEDEEAMCLTDVLEGGERTVQVEVTVTFIAENGRRYNGTRVIKISLRREATKEGK